MMAACCNSPDRRQLACLTLLSFLALSCRHDVASEGATKNAEPEPLPVPYTLDIGEPAAQPHLKRGWSQPETFAGTDVTWVWAVAPRSVIEIELARVSYQALELRCWPYVYEGAPPQTVEVEINGRRLELIELISEPHTYTLQLPVGMLFAGRNQLAFRFGYNQAPIKLDPSRADARPLAVAFDSLHLVPGVATAALAPIDPHDLFARGDMSRFFTDQESFKVELAGQTRNAYPAFPGETLRHTVAVGSDSALDLALGIACPGEHCAGGWTFKVEAASGRFWRRKEMLLERTLVVGEAVGWVEERLTLASLARGEEVRPVEVELSVSPSVSTASSAGLMPVAVWGEPFMRPAPPRSYTNVVMISIDTLRADRLGAYGHTRDTSPHLDALAAGGVRFARTYSQAPWTTPSHMTLLTSLHPSAHRVNQGWAEFFAFAQGRAGYRLPPAEIEPLATILQRYGYHTLAITGGTTIAGKLGFWRGFDIYQETGREGFRRLTPRIESLLSELLERQGADPFFLFFQTFEVHAPYVDLDFAAEVIPAVEHRELERLFATEVSDPIGTLAAYLEERGLMRSEVTSALYDGGIRYTDAALGRLFAELRRLGLWEKTLVVVVSDHGEEFAEHDPGRFYDAHCHSLYDELLRVPWLMHLPGVVPAATVVERPVGLIDVAPTVLDLLGLPIPEAMQGWSRLAWAVGGGGDASDGTSGAEKAWVASEATCIGPEMKALVSPRHKYLAAYRTASGERTGIGEERLWERLFDLDLDPAEQHDLAAVDPQLTAFFRQRLARHFATVMRADDEAMTLEVDSELHERLRALGYVD